MGKSKTRAPYTGHLRQKQGTPNNHGDAPGSLEGYSVNQAWGALKSCWRAYKGYMHDARGRPPNHEKGRIYALRIRKWQAALGIEITEFPDLGIFGTDPSTVDFTCD